MPAELNLPACLTIRKNDDIAAEQKFVLVSAIYMKAFLVIKRIYLSRHQRKHLIKQLTTLYTVLSLFPIASYFFAIYSNTIRMNVINAIKNEPKAIDP